MKTILRTLTIILYVLSALVLMLASFGVLSYEYCTAYHTSMIFMILIADKFYNI